MLELAGLGSTNDRFPPPRACAIAEGTLLEDVPPEGQPAVFLAPPRNDESLEGAYRWADERGLAILPRFTCSEELLADTGRGSDLAVWRISSPRTGDTVSGSLPIVGTADFDPHQIQFYKVEIGSGENPQDWVTIGETHNTPVVGDRLETLLAAAFEPGVYSLRLVVVQWDGNYVGEPDTVTVTIE